MKTNKWTIFLFAIVSFIACNPDAHWVAENVDIKMASRTVSAGYIEYSFTPDQDAYYLIACVPAKEDLNPQDQPKQFMTLALDSAYTEYINWRNWLLKKGEFNIAPFASHSLQYGPITHFFTNLAPDTDYWIYAFVVNPETLKPSGKLFLETIRTTETSVMNVRFDYRVRGYWDYIYPINNDSINDPANYGKINNTFPYLAATRDSAELEDHYHLSPEEYFDQHFMDIAQYNVTSFIRYGVQVVENDSRVTGAAFEEGHTYYTAIVSFDGFIGNNVIYKFTWTGEEFEAYFTDENSIVSNGEDY